LGRKVIGSAQVGNLLYRRLAVGKAGTRVRPLKWSAELLLGSMKRR
jgi:hypothetical protein